MKINEKMEQENDFEILADLEEMEIEAGIRNLKAVAKTNLAAARKANAETQLQKIATLQALLQACQIEGLESCANLTPLIADEIDRGIIQAKIIQLVKAL